MKYKGYLLDIDNTLYEYDRTHSIAIDHVLTYFSQELSIEKSNLNEGYREARSQIHHELSETAASHNRLLYFQRMFEILEINSANYSLKAYQLYWEIFIQNIVPFDGVYDFLESIKNYKICFVTDLTADVQFKKIEKMNLQQYCDYVVTSEEAGREKPHPYMFLLALQKMKLTSSDVCMIGDSFNKDIVGASNLGIDSYWLNNASKAEDTSHGHITEIKNFNELMRYVKK
ncbi:putative hydrolase of the HAD superfamily [Paenibacillus tianmuensis]|uniref:Putative hydrolase of the HAD superfamily n=1 Tax=Paenibacillus tianmuensis TaxID=624147 RepID=A0A1G4TW48_9BACL|nr:HAD family hydrolase [Paenibacillus tianmuensis]SCW85547.1 putative hydrolase of the HAD superfamily [Paenibacillus tianmuensis]